MLWFHGWCEVMFLCCIIHCTDVLDMKVLFMAYIALYAFMGVGSIYTLEQL
jgi:hypothetical protein